MIVSDLAEVQGLGLSGMCEKLSKVQHNISGTSAHDIT